MHMLVDASADAVCIWEEEQNKKKWQNGKTWVKNICFRILREFCRVFLVWVRGECALRYNGISGQCASRARILFLSLNFWISWSLLNTWLHSLAISNTPFQLKLQITAQINQRTYRKNRIHRASWRKRESERRKKRKLSTISFYLSAFLVCF